MKAEEYARSADMIVAGYAYLIRDGYVEVIDLANTKKRAVIQNGDIVESLMTDEEDDIVLKYYVINRDLMEESVHA